MRDEQAPALRQARLALRQQARRLVQTPADVNTHLACLQAALALPGAEPVQGALADVFVALGESKAPFKQTALQMARERLAAHVVRWFAAEVAHSPLSRITPLATRWSVLARPSADISTRARRCSGDDSRVLAEHMVKAVESADQAAQQAFLHHCVTCHDNLAFMLARRVLLRMNATLPDGWEAVSRQLEQPREFA